MHWQLPEPLSVCEISLDLQNRSFVRQYGNSSGPRLVLSHGNGLAIDLYYPFWSLLEADFELFVYDLRSHGWNDVASEEDHNLISLVTDLHHILLEIEEHYGSKPTVGIFHSVSAMIALLQSSTIMAKAIDQGSDGFDGLVLFDPPLHQPGKSSAEFDEAVEQTARSRSNRTENFESYEQYVELLNFFPQYSRLVPGAKELLAHSILRESPNGGCELRCPRDHEVRIIKYMRAFAGQVEFDTVPCPIKIVGADPLLPTSYLPTVDFSDMLSVDFDFIPESTHYMQIERPHECAEYVREFVSSLKFD